MHDNGTGIAISEYSTRFVKKWYRCIPDTFFPQIDIYDRLILSEVLRFLSCDDFMEILLGSTIFFFGLTSIIITLPFSLIAQMVLHFLQNFFLIIIKNIIKELTWPSVELSIFFCSKFISFLKEKRKKQSQLKRLELSWDAWSPRYAWHESRKKQD